MSRRRRGSSPPSPEVARLVAGTLAACRPRGPVATSVRPVAALAVLGMKDQAASSVTLRLRAGAVRAISSPADVTALVERLFEQEGRALVRLARLFVDDRNAAEDLVQEGFIRLARNAGRIRDEANAAAYLRSIVLNLARDHNRRGLVSLRHHLPFDDGRASTEDEIVLRDDQREVLEVLRELPRRQRDVLVLRYYEELGVDEIALTLGISRNSVKTHLQRGLAAMERRLGLAHEDRAPEVEA